MHDPGAVRGIKRVGDLDRNLQRLLNLDPSSRDLLVERLAVEILHDEIVSPVLVAHVIKRADVRMCERGDCLGFAFEAGFQFGIGRGQDLDGDRAIEARVPRFVDLAEAACAEWREDVVGAEADAGTERHLNFESALDYTEGRLGDEGFLWATRTAIRPSRSRWQSRRSGSSR
ncbi:MAG TPA: hypothetical protein VKE51_31990 [Vicinamibacterales bacterium]|nr:hypothetical protein [Vicinamibacterales bacterium]